MCGIAGIISRNGHLNDDAQGIVEKMIDKLHHRGPDAAGYHHDESCSMGMRRLSIIDLDHGNQPIFNEKGDVLVFQNGEIYNYQILKKELEEKGHVFSTESDTEVLVHLYEEYGLKMFSHLNGMFAFCLYDKSKGIFVIARDRFGEKPLYYSQDQNTLSFSSEIASLLEQPAINRVMNFEALAYYLRTSLIPSPITLFQNVSQLPAGHYMCIGGENIIIEKYFNLDYQIDSSIKTIDDAVEFIRPKLEAAVQRQSISDVPVGSFLSGGIDSSSLVALRQKQSSVPIKTFNVRFEEEEYDESKIARSVAEYCGTDHHEVVIANQEFDEDIFWKIINHVGQPFRDSSAIPTYQISKEIGTHVKVAISGDGGDEMFGGYSLFNWYTKILRLKRVPSSVRNLLQVSTNILGKTGILSTKVRQINRVLETAQMDEDEIPIALNEMFSSVEIDRLLDKSSASQSITFSRLKEHSENSYNRTNLRKIMHYRTQHTLTNNMLVKVDSMSMANSLEVRAPFLDKDLSDAAAQLPDEFLMKNGLGKLVLREMMKSDLPPEVFSHPKQGFNLPLHKFQNQAFHSLARRLLFEENPLPELFKVQELEQIFARGINQKEDNNAMSAFRASHQLWMIMQLIGWAKRFKVSLN